WEPSLERKANSQMQHFLDQMQLENYQALYEWSIANPQQFWPALWDFFNVVASKRWDTVVENFDQMPGAKWFQGARLNFAENLLKRRDDKPALIFNNERGERRSLSHAVLYQNVAQLAAAMRGLGIKPNDTIAGFMPNTPET